jgi:preprotein translocase subunit SecE
MNPIKFLQETQRELAKVTWPSRQQTQNMTLLVIIVSVLVGAYLGLLDIVFQKLMSFIL